MRLVITNKLGVVHNWLNGTCEAVEAAYSSERNGLVAHKVITGKQAQVYQLPFCLSCFGDVGSFRAEIVRS